MTGLIESGVNWGVFRGITLTSRSDETHTSLRGKCNDVNGVLGHLCFHIG